MKKRTVWLLLLSLTIVVAMYGVQLVSAHADWFERPSWIQFTARYVFYFMPLLIVLSWVKQLTTFIGIMTIGILILVLTYGFVHVGTHEMISHDYIHYTILFSIDIMVLFLIIFQLTKKHATQQKPIE